MKSKCVYLLSKLQRITRYHLIADELFIYFNIFNWKPSHLVLIKASCFFLSILFQEFLYDYLCIWNFQRSAQKIVASISSGTDYRLPIINVHFNLIRLKWTNTACHTLRLFIIFSWNWTFLLRMIIYSRLWNPKISVE